MCKYLIWKQCVYRKCEHDDEKRTKKEIIPGKAVPNISKIVENVDKNITDKTV